MAELRPACQEMVSHTQEIIAEEKESQVSLNKEVIKGFKNTKSFNIFVYCGGKCGSSTLLNTFTKNNYSAIQIHGNSYYMRVINRSGYTSFNLINASHDEYETIYLIDSYRTPIERKISSFFQNIRQHVPNYKNLTIAELIAIFNKQFIYTLEEYHPINDVLTHYQLPLFTSFNYEKKYNLVKKENKIFIKILFKDIDNWETILSGIFQKPITIYPDNLTSDTENYSLYKEFLKKYKVPKAYLDVMEQNDTEFKIYNTAEEQQAYITKWMERINV